MQTERSLHLSFSITKTTLAHTHKKKTKFEKKSKSVLDIFIWGKNTSDEILPKIEKLTCNLTIEEEQGEIEKNG